MKDAPVLRCSTGAICYPLSSGQYLMCGTAKDGEEYAAVVTLHRPEDLEVVKNPEVDTLLEHLRQAGESLADRPHR